MVSDKYRLSYIVPEIIPPSYDMRFAFIDLATIQDELKMSILNNMKYEMQQHHKLLFNYRLKNGEMVLAIRRDESIKHHILILL